MNQLRSELLKLRTAPATWMLLLAAAAVTLLGALSEGLSRDVGELAAEAGQREPLTAAVTAVLFATLAGLVSVTAEFRYGTIRPTLLFQPRRTVVLAAKLTVAGLAGAAFGLACLAVSFGAGLTILAVRDVPVALSFGASAGIWAGTIAAACLGGILGVAIGALIRNQVGAIVAVAAYAVAVDAGLFAAAPSVGRYLPGKAGDALAGLPTDHLLGAIGGAVVVAAWTLAFVLAAAIRTTRSDV